MTNSPCKDCETRYPGCHSKCELYLDWQQVHRAELTTIKINKLADNQAIAYKAEKRMVPAHLKHRRSR